MSFKYFDKKCVTNWRNHNIESTIVETTDVIIYDFWNHFFQNIR